MNAEEEREEFIRGIIEDLASAGFSKHAIRQWFLMRRRSYGNQSPVEALTGNWLPSDHVVWRMKQISAFVRKNGRK